MLSLYRDSDDSIDVDGKIFNIDCNFNVVLANLELSQDKNINDYTKIDVALKNYLNVSDEQLSFWDYEKRLDIYIRISLKIFDAEQKQTSGKDYKDDKSVYSFSEDADYIFASFLKDYGINLLEMRNKMHWNEFKALFISLSETTKMAEIMRIRSWTASKDESKEHKENMRKLQKIYALKQTQQEIERIDIERKKMAMMSPDERIEYAKKKLEEGG